jgi:hypothetical protein
MRMKKAISSTIPQETYHSQRSLGTCLTYGMNTELGFVVVSLLRISLPRNEDK